MLSLTMKDDQIRYIFTRDFGGDFDLSPLYLHNIYACSYNRNTVNVEGFQISLSMYFRNNQN